MLKYLIIFWGIICISLYGNEPAAAVDEPVIIPRPQTVTMGKGFFPYEAACKIQNIQVADLAITPNNPKMGSDISFELKKQIKGDEAYELEVTPNKITIRAQAAAGFFYGYQTLLQLRNSATEDGIPACLITDAPRFSWRGFMLDEGRHFFGKKEVKRILEIMAMHKMNRFHWHLTDSEGWRIEIKKYPKLTTIGSIGDWTSFQRNPYNPQGEPRFYTQDDIREIVQYAKDRCIEIIPEIDMPGHASAMNRAYPEYDGGGNARLPRFTVNPGKEETYSYLVDILKEVTELFPSQWIHFGGDEVHFANKGWESSPDVRALMKKEKLANLHEVEWYFNRRMANEIRKLGKICVGWDEVVSAKLPTAGSIICWWRHDKSGVLKNALKKGYPIVLCPRHPCYFDFLQDNAHKHGRRWDGFNSWERVYNFPDLEKLGVSNAQTAQILGIQACLWSETVPSTNRMEYLTFPRLQVLAESAWTIPFRKDIERFRTKSLPAILKSCHNLGLKYYNPFNPKSTPEIAPKAPSTVDYIDPANTSTQKE